MLVISQILIDLCLGELHWFQLFSNCFTLLKDEIHGYFEIDWFYRLLFFIRFGGGISHGTPFEGIGFVGFIFWILFEQYFSCAVWLVSRNTSYFCEIEWNFLRHMQFRMLGILSMLSFKFFLFRSSFATKCWWLLFFEIKVITWFTQLLEFLNCLNSSGLNDICLQIILLHCLWYICNIFGIIFN